MGRACRWSNTNEACGAVVLHRKDLDTPKASRLKVLQCPCSHIMCEQGQLEPSWNQAGTKVQPSTTIVEQSLATHAQILSSSIVLIIGANYIEFILSVITIKHNILSIHRPPPPTATTTTTVAT